MKRLLIAATISATIMVGSVGARPADAAVGMPVAGGAIGEGAVVLPDPGPPSIPTVWEENGGYATDGQLGHGTYSFSGTFGMPGCHVSGSARMTRSDGAVLIGTVTGIVTPCEGGPGSERLSLDLTTGTRDLVRAGLSFVGVHGEGGALPEPGFNFSDHFQISGELSVTSRIGYVLTDGAGIVSSFGGAPSFSSLWAADATRVVLTPSRNGYWVVDASGRVVSFGDARWFGDTPSLTFGETVRTLLPTPTSRGYWLVTSNGRVFAFGDAHFFGDLRRLRLNGAIVDGASTPNGDGYYLVGSDGGIFAFGGAHFYGSTGNLRLNQPIDGIATTATGHGYWLAASDGGIFTFGDARFRGSMGGRPLAAPVVGIARYGTGYLLVASDGGVFKFSPQLFFGSGVGESSRPIVAVAATG
jgi:hypothetical protein